MWVIYNIKEFRIVGLTAIAAFDPDKPNALAEVVKGLVKPGDPSDYDAIQVSDAEKALEYLRAFPEKLVLTAGPDAPKISIREPEIFSLHVTIDAPDVHPVDGIPEIPADGESSALITIQKIDERFKPQQGDQDNETIYLRTDQGVIRDVAVNQDINSVTLAKGQAMFRLFSQTLKRVATVQMINANPKLKDTSIRIEFI